ncbi:MAG: sel1 repeat family protein [Parachlamydiaceae bacterium]|nr:sel1 repeat family protein [Parachlamydiaceae bacterium]
MTFNITQTAKNFQAVASSFDKANHLYITIDRDSKNQVTGCNFTSNRDERASVKEINAFVINIYQQYNPEDAQAFENIKSIRTDLQTIKEHVENKDRGCCGLSHLWFLIKRGHTIVADTEEILVKISNIAQNLISPKKTKNKKEDRKEQSNSSKNHNSQVVETKKETTKNENSSEIIPPIKKNEIKNDTVKQQHNSSNKFEASQVEGKEKNEKSTNVLPKSFDLTETSEIVEKKKKEVSKIDVILAKAEECTKCNDLEEMSKLLFQASQCYEKEENFELAFKYLKKSCENDESDLEALKRLGKCYEQGELGQDKDLFLARKTYFSAVLKCEKRVNFKDELLSQCKNVLRCHASQHSLMNFQACKTIVIMAKNSLELDFSSLILDQKVRGELYFQAGKYLIAESKNSHESEINTLMLLSEKEGNPDAMSWLGSEKQPGSEDWFFIAAQTYRILNQPTKAIEHYEKSAKSGNLEAILSLSVCYRDGGLGLKKNNSLASKYQLDAAKVYFDLKENIKFTLCCLSAIGLSKYTAIVEIILDFKIDITTLVEKVNIPDLREVHGAYIKNINDYLSVKDLKKALEQCRYSFQFGSLPSDIVLTLINKFNFDLANLIPDQNERAKLYFKAAQHHYKQKTSCHFNLLENIELFLKAADEGSIDAMLELASIYTKADKKDLAFAMWVKSAKLGSFEAAKLIIFDKGNLNDVFETPEERASVFLRLAERNSSTAKFFYEKAYEEGSLEAMAKLGKAYLANPPVIVSRFHINDPYLKQNSIKSHDDLGLPYDETKGSQMLLDAAKLYEEREQQKEALEIYHFLADKIEKFSEIEILEKLALCFERGEFEQRKDLKKAGGYYFKIAKSYIEQISYKQSEEEKLLHRQASLKACVRAFLLDSVSAVELLKNTLKDDYKTDYKKLFDDEMKDMIAKKTAQHIDAYEDKRNSPFSNKVALKSEFEDVIQDLVTIEKALGLNQDKYSKK